jgi:hypothetical protein
VTTDQVITNLSLIQRDDGALANGSVGPDQLASSVSIGMDPPEAWAAAQAYTLTSVVTYANKFYVATSAHTSAVANRPDQGGAPWEELVDLASISIADGAVTAAKLATDAVTTAKILDGTITTRKLINGAVDAPVLATDAVTTVKILDANVTTAKIADANVTTAKIADDAVTYAKLQNVSATNRILARYSSGAGNVEEATLGSGVSFVAGALTVTGKLAQVVNTTTGARVALAGTVAQDDTIPQSSEGTEAFTRSITPTNASSTLVIQVTVNAAVLTAVSDLVVALFQDSTANALAVASTYVDTIGGRRNVTFTHYMTAGTTSATTFKVRVGTTAGAGASAELNATGGGARLYGGVMSSSITITEILP